MENVHRMIAEGDLDHRYYEYPGLFFYLLYPVLRVVMGADPPTAAAYLPPGPCRGPAAWPRWRCSSPSRGGWSPAWAALLRGRAARRLAGRGADRAHGAAGRRAAGLLPPRPRRPPARGRAARRATCAAGAALGAAAAVKFSGVFLVPAFVAAAAAHPRRAVPPGSPGGAAAALAVFAIFSPYAFLHLGEFVAGVETQVAYHYEESRRSRPREVVPADGRPLPARVGEDARGAGGGAVRHRPRGRGAAIRGGGCRCCSVPCPGHRRLRHLAGPARPVPAPRPGGRLRARRRGVGGGVDGLPPAGRPGRRGRAGRCRCSPRSRYVRDVARPAHRRPARSTGRRARSRRAPACSPRLDLGLDESGRSRSSRSPASTAARRCWPPTSCS